MYARTTLVAFTPLVLILAHLNVRTVVLAALPPHLAQRTPISQAGDASLDIRTRVQYIDRRLADELSQVGGAATDQRRKAFLFSIANVVLAAAVTVLLGWKAENPNQEANLKRLALVLGALITVVSSIDAFYDHRSLWLKSTMTLARLQEVRDRFDFYRAGRPPQTIEEKDLSQFVDELEQIRQEHIGAWSQLRQAQKKSQ